MRITVNGEVHDLPDPCLVEELMVRLELPDRGVALAVNRNMLTPTPGTTSDEDGRTLQVITAVQQAIDLSPFTGPSIDDLESVWKDNPDHCPLGNDTNE